MSGPIVRRKPDLRGQARQAEQEVKQLMKEFDGIGRDLRRYQRNGLYWAGAAPYRIVESYDTKENGRSSLTNAYYIALAKWTRDYERVHKVCTVPSIFERQRKVLKYIDFKGMSTNLFQLYLYYGNKRVSLKLYNRYRIALQKYRNLSAKILRNGLREHMNDPKMYTMLSTGIIYCQAEFSILDKLYNRDRTRGKSWFQGRLGRGSHRTQVHELIWPRNTRGKGTAIRRPTGRATRRDNGLVWKRPVMPLSKDLLTSPDPYRVLDRNIGTETDRATRRAFYDKGKPDYRLLPIIGPLIDVKRKYYEIKTKNGRPGDIKVTGTDDKQRDGKLKTIHNGHVLKIWHKERQDFVEVGMIGPKDGWTDIYVNVVHGIPSTVRSYDPRTRKWKTGKIKVTDWTVEMTVWNTRKNGFVTIKVENFPQVGKTGKYHITTHRGRPKAVISWDNKGNVQHENIERIRIAEYKLSGTRATVLAKKPKAGWMDYGAVVLYTGLAVLDSVFIAQAFTRTAVRSAGAKAFIGGTTREMETYVYAMGTMRKAERTALIDIARHRGSWQVVARELRAAAGGGRVTEEVLRNYVRINKIGGSWARRAAIKVGRGTRDFMGNLLTLGRRKAYRHQMVVEFMKEMRITTDFKVVRAIVDSLRKARRAGVVVAAQEKAMVRAVFSTMTSFSKGAQRAFLAVVEKPGGWQKLLRNIERERNKLRRVKGLRSGGRQAVRRRKVLSKAEEAEAIQRGLAATIPKYERALWYGPKWRMLQEVGFAYLFPRALHVGLKQFESYIQNKIRIRMDKEKTHRLFEVLEMGAKMAQSQNKGGMFSYFSKGQRNDNK